MNLHAVFTVQFMVNGVLPKQLVNKADCCLETCYFSPYSSSVEVEWLGFNLGSMFQIRLLTLSVVIFRLYSDNYQTSSCLNGYIL